jgi:1-aminocyclopropane-1-carboxylate deaminase/D-cysteine desulfhydrase-like pyridoxal-dependent ACC family enzyme
MIISDPSELTPIQEVGRIFIKRDDLFEVAEVPGGKVRTCLALASKGWLRGANTLVTAGSRSSPQVNIVAHIAAHLGMEARCHTPMGALSPEVEAARVWGAEIIQHKAGYNSVIIARAHADALLPGRCEIPFGMECEEAVTQTRRQVANIPAGVQRIVIPVGSGMSLAGVLHGLIDRGIGVHVLGVCVGADPTKRLDMYGPNALLHGRDWRSMVTLVPSGSDYHKPAVETMLGDIKLDPHYESKCISFLCSGDLLWCVGIRATAR